MSTPPPRPNGSQITEAVRALEGRVLSDFVFGTPGNVKDISKAADLVSNTIEDVLPELLNGVRSTTWDEDDRYLDYEFRKSPGFPDCLLVKRDDPGQVLFEIEAKSWYVLSDEPITARFYTDQGALEPDALLVVVAWLLDGVISGSPKLLRIHVDNAVRVASVRDAEWTRSGSPGEPNRRVQSPDNPTGTPVQNRRTQTIGEIQDVSGVWRKDSDNFGKLGRMHDSEIDGFKNRVLELVSAGKTLGEWKSFVNKRSTAIGRG